MTLIQRAEAYRDQLEKRALTIRELAGILGCSESYLSRTFSPTLKRLESTTSQRKKHKKLLEGRREMKKRHAESAYSGQISLKKAAANAKCSERTIRRYIEKLWPSRTTKPKQLAESLSVSAPTRKKNSSTSERKSTTTSRSGT